MANYYTQASFLVSFETKEKENEASTILSALENHEDEPCQGELKDLAKAMELEDYCYVGFSCQDEDSLTWWIYADETIDVNRTVQFFEYLVRKDLCKPFGFQWADTCSKARLDAFGGGAVLISKEGTEWMSTDAWLFEQNQKANGEDV